MPARSQFGFHIQCSIWSEVITRIDRDITPERPTRTHIARLAVATFREACLAENGTDLVALPSIYTIGEGYEQPIHDVPLVCMPVLQFTIERGSEMKQWFEALKAARMAASNAQILRHVVAYQVPRLSA